MRQRWYVNGVRSRSYSAARSRVPVMTTIAPAAWNARATADPMPEVPPVTSTRAPAKSNAAPVIPTPSSRDLRADGEPVEVVVESRPHRVGVEPEVARQVVLDASVLAARVLGHERAE